MAPTMKRQSVAVIGAGIIGVSTAVNIQALCPEMPVTLIAEKFSPDTTSDGAAGFLQPYLAPGTSKEDIRRWFTSTLDSLSKLAQSQEAAKAGVHLTSGYTLFMERVPDPEWKDLMHGFRHVTPAELRHFFPAFKHGWHSTTMICESHRYIPFLTERFLQNGGMVMQKKVSSFAELSGQYDIVVNCTGVWARFLANDDSVQPVRGQIMKVHAPWLLCNNRCPGDAAGNNKHHIYARQADVIVGGTAQVGRWDTEVDPKDAKDIWEKVCSISPSLKEAKILNHWVGLRPVRTRGIRVEMESVNYGGDKMKIVHNYGHGGCGITLHWGCAQDAAKLVQRELSRTPAARL